MYEFQAFLGPVNYDKQFLSDRAEIGRTLAHWRKYPFRLEWPRR